MKEKEAEELLKKLVNEEQHLHREIFCPEIKNYCRVDCIQYVKTTGDLVYVNGDKVNGWEVNLHKGYCLRYMR